MSLNFILCIYLCLHVLAYKSHRPVGQFAGHYESQKSNLSHLVWQQKFLLEEPSWQTPMGLIRGMFRGVHLGPWVTPPPSTLRRQDPGDDTLPDIRVEDSSFWYQDPGFLSMCRQMLHRDSGSLRQLCLLSHSNIHCHYNRTLKGNWGKKEQMHRRKSRDSKTVWWVGCLPQI